MDVHKKTKMNRIQICTSLPNMDTDPQTDVHDHEWKLNESAPVNKGNPVNVGLGHFQYQPLPVSTVKLPNTSPRVIL